MMVLVLMMLMMLMMLYNLSTDKQRVKRRDPVRPTWAVGSRNDTVVVYLGVIIIIIMIIMMTMKIIIHRGPLEVKKIPLLCVGQCHVDDHRVAYLPVIQGNDDDIKT